jgi:hypothetical protein
MGTMDIRTWMRRRPIVSGVLTAATLGLLAVAAAFTAKPRADREWVEHLSFNPQVVIGEDAFTVAMMTDWGYTAEGPSEKLLTARTERFADLRNVWFVVEPHPGMRPMAHTLVLFEFAGDRIVGLTIEARREADEKYSALWGTFNAFELAYVWSTARDLLVRRALFLDHDVLVYPIDLPPERKERFLRNLLAKTQSLSGTPRFYNTLFSNCTNELAKTANLPWRPAYILTGYSAEELFKMKLIPGESMETARAQALLTEEIKGWSDLDARAFDAALLGELRRRSRDGGQVAERAR